MELASLKSVLLVARHGSFAAAARVMGVDPSSVSRTVAGIEQELGIRLFQRSTRRLSQTEEGAAYIAHIAPLLEEFDHAHDLARQAGLGPSGTLKMTASVSFAHFCVVPHLAEFTAKFPDITLELLPTDSNVDLIAENIDLALRLAPAPRGDLISTKLVATRYVVCAAPDYVKTTPSISAPLDLEKHDCLRFALADYRTRWRFRSATSEPVDVPVSGKIIISNALSLRRAALDGLGPALLPDWLVRSDLAKGDLIDLLPGYEAAASSFETAAWALYPSRSYLPLKVRCMIDFLRQKLR